MYFNLYLILSIYIHCYTIHCLGDVSKMSWLMDWLSSSTGKPTSMSINVDGLHCSMGGKSHMPLSMRTMGPNGWLELVAFADLGSVLFSLCLHWEVSQGCRLCPQVWLIGLTSVRVLHGTIHWRSKVTGTCSVSLRPSQSLGYELVPWWLYIIDIAN